MPCSRTSSYETCDPHLPVLLFHRIAPPPHREAPPTISPIQFSRHLRALQRRGYSTITTEDWLAWRERGRPLPKKPVLLTFDDGYADLADHAFPLLKQYGFRATVFMVSGEINGSNRWDQSWGCEPHPLLRADQIRSWSADGIEFAAHTRTHARLPGLSAVSLGEEVSGSARELRELLGVPVHAFAYPYGAYDRAVRDRVAGEFSLAFTAEEGLNTSSTDPLLLKRSMVAGNETWVDFALRTRYGYSPLMRLRGRLRLRTRARQLFAFARHDP